MPVSVGSANVMPQNDFNTTMKRVEFLSVEFLNGSAHCPLEDALELDIVFKALSPIRGARWQIEVSFMGLVFLVLFLIRGFYLLFYST